MAEYSNAHPPIYSGLEPENEYSIPEGDGDHSDKGSISGGSDHGSGSHRNGSDGHHDDDHKGHDRDGDLSDREDGRSDKEDRRSDRRDSRSDRGSRRSDRSDRRSDKNDDDSHSVHDREGSVHGSDDGSRDHRDDLSGDVYDALDEMNDLVEHAEAEQSFYNNAAEQDRKSDDSHSDGEGEGHVRAVRSGSLVGDARANDGDDIGIYEELPDHRSDSDGSEMGERVRGHAGQSDDLYDDTGFGHAHRENGHQRRGSRDSDEENHRSSVDGRVKRQTSATTPTSSGKFMLRTSRKADALHILRHIRDSSSAEDNPELDELVTVLRSTDHNSKHDDNLDEEKQKEKLKSFITSKLIHKFEQGIASDDAFNENHDNYQAANTSRINDRHNTTVVKTTVVKTTVKTDSNHPASSKGTGVPKSPPAVASGSNAASDVSRSSSSSSLSSASQIHQKSVTHDSHGSNHGATKSITVTSVQVTVNPSKHPSNELPKTPDESTVPAWKAEIEMRKKTKSHVPTQKPREPMKMSEVPEWKKQLQEKNKMKKLSSSDETDITLARVTTVEMDRLKHEVVITSHGAHGAHGGRGDNHLPEWARLADEKHKTISH